MEIFLQMVAISNDQIFGHRLGGAGGAPAWLPEGAVAGVDYTEGEAWLFDTLITDLSTIHGDGGIGEFDPAAITAAGMAVTNANTNRPAATNELAEVILANDYCVLFDWDALTFNNPPSSAIFLYADESGAGNFINAQLRTSSGNVQWCDGNNGNFNTVGVATQNTRNKVAASANADGWLASLNGTTASLDGPVTPALVSPPVRVFIGCSSSGGAALNGTIRRIIFYPNEQNAAFVEALAAL